MHPADAGRILRELAEHATTLPAVPDPIAIAIVDLGIAFFPDGRPQVRLTRASSEVEEPDTPGHGVRRGKVPEARWVEAWQWWQAGVSAVEIADRLAVTAAAVYSQARRRGWRTRAGFGSARTLEEEIQAEEQRVLRPAEPPPTPPAPPKPKVIAPVQCRACTLMTDRDPCRHCGQKPTYYGGRGSI